MGLWLREIGSEPLFDKGCLLQFYKGNSKTQDSQVMFLSNLLILIPLIAWIVNLERQSLPEEIKGKQFGNFFMEVVKLGTGWLLFAFVNEVNNPTLITDFALFSLIGIHYKIIAKILANRLSKVIDKIVSKEQSAFIAGRQILDGPVILSEIIECFGFGNKWCSWIKACLNSSRASILINGSPTSEFSIKRGLRQGDLYLLFLFILVMEVDCDITKIVYAQDMDKIIVWKTLVDRFHMRLSSWKANLLSIGGRLTLIKSVLGSLGGLNIGSLKAFNLALLQKLALGVTFYPNALWFRSSKLIMVQKEIESLSRGMDIPAPSLVLLANANVELLIMFSSKGDIASICVSSFLDGVIFLFFKLLLGILSNDWIISGMLLK
ncbi:hypothetical protein Tco_0727635 [Tanacetum coccineum]|uniref:Reverse transcriptase domain-containing protein n=1 Tax=Tanacetum coccineum TaxID=301880 RepID=A0ABQ4YIW2_9ASTR